MSNGWIGVDLDGTLAEYQGWKGADHIGPPVKAMLERVLKWRKQGREVRIFTARVWPMAMVEPKLNAQQIAQRNTCVGLEQRAMAAAGNIQLWCAEHLGEILPITCQKDYGMIELWDDRCVQVELNTGRILGSTKEMVL